MCPRKRVPPWTNFFTISICRPSLTYPLPACSPSSQPTVPAPLPRPSLKETPSFKSNLGSWELPVSEGSLPSSWPHSLGYSRAFPHLCFSVTKIRVPPRCAQGRFLGGGALDSKDVEHGRLEICKSLLSLRTQSSSWTVALCNL